MYNCLILKKNVDFPEMLIKTDGSLLTSIVSVLLPQNLILKAILWRIFILLRWIYIGEVGRWIYIWAVDLHRGSGAVGRWIYIGAVKLHRGGGFTQGRRGGGFTQGRRIYIGAVGRWIYIGAVGRWSGSR